MANIIIRKYEHLNRSMGNWDTPHGKRIRNKRHYEDEMKRGGYISQQESDAIIDRRAEDFRNKKMKPTKGTLEILKFAQEHKKRDGSVKLSDRIIDKMIKTGAVQDKDKFMKQINEAKKEGSL